MISCSKNDSEDLFEEKDEQGFVGYWRGVQELRNNLTLTMYFALDANARGFLGLYLEQQQHDAYRVSAFECIGVQWSFNNSILTIDAGKEYDRLAILSKTDKMWIAEDPNGEEWRIERMSNLDFCSFISLSRDGYIFNEDDGSAKRPSIFKKELERNGFGKDDIIVAKNPNDIFNPNKAITYLSPTDHKTEAGSITIKNPYDFSKWKITFSGLISGTYYYDVRDNK